MTHNNSLINLMYLQDSSIERYNYETENVHANLNTHKVMFLNSKLLDLGDACTPYLYMTLRTLDINNWASFKCDLNPVVFV